MKSSALFHGQDFILIKWQIAIAVFSLLLSIGIYLGVSYLDDQSVIDLRQAQRGYQDARLSVDLIEEEESTIIEYIGRYEELSRDGIVENEDRLQFLEEVAEIRSENDLFPIRLNINEQVSLRLRYDPSESDPGGPIDLKTSVVDLSLPLLHEEDLTRLIGSILASPGLFQAQECNINLQNTSNNFLYLSQHLNASCSLLWYTFDTRPEPGFQ